MSNSENENTSTGEEYEESEESDIPESSSSSSAFDAYGGVHDTFLAHNPANMTTDGVRLKLTNFELDGGLLMQFVKPTISIICTKCLKMMSLELSPEKIKDEYGNVKDSDLLSGEAPC